MASMLSYLNPVPTFPDYSGPNKVGTIDIEIPVSELSSPSRSPDHTISTIAFRVFYPTGDTHKQKKWARWVPDPQREYVAAFARLAGSSPRLARLMSYILHPTYHITIPALPDAQLLQPQTAERRWPVMVFSHGLTGFRNAYSHLCGSLASYGVVVFAPEHRDGSAAITFIKGQRGSTPITKDYLPISHTLSSEVYEARDQQLETRLWELGLVHDALLKIDQGDNLSNFAATDDPQKIGEQGNLSMFINSLDVHRPGSISWCGHSFGAATMVQFVKSVFYRASQSDDDTYKPLYQPRDDSSVVRQITPSTTICLLDLWNLPLMSESKQWLRKKPLPCYASGGQGGSNVLAILSESFFKWRDNLIQTKKIISENPEQAHRSQITRRPPHIFYPLSSAHLSQSDFGLLYPWITKRFLGALEPERTLRLNVRAILEVMRQNGTEVADTSKSDMEEEQTSSHVHHKHHHDHAKPKVDPNQTSNSRLSGAPLIQDRKILMTDGSIRAWVAISVDEEVKAGEASNEKTTLEAEPSDAVLETKFTPSHDGVLQDV